MLIISHTIGVFLGENPCAKTTPHPQDQEMTLHQGPSWELGPTAQAAQAAARQAGCAKGQVDLWSMDSMDYLWYRKGPFQSTSRHFS